MASRVCFAVLGLTLFSSRGQAQSTRESSFPTTSLNARVDVDGDPLPHGARARLGSTRLRLGGEFGTAALSADGKWIASMNSGNVLSLSEPTTGKEISRLVIPGTGAAVVAFAPDGRSIAVVGLMPYVQIVAIPSGKLLAKLPFPQPSNGRLSSFRFSGDGKIFIAGTDNFGQSKNFVHAWEIPSGRRLHDFEVSQNSQIRGAISHDGTVLVTSGQYHPRGGLEGNPDQGRTIQVWDMNSGKELGKVKIERGPITAVALSPDGKTIAAASGNATFHLFDTLSHKELRRFAGRRGYTQLLQFSPDAAILAAGSADGTVQLWDAATGKRLGLCDGPRPQLLSIAFPSIGQVWALGMEGQAIALWDVVHDRRLSPSAGHITWVRFLAYADGGKTLVSGGADGKLCWWDPLTPKELRHYVIRDDYRHGGYPLGLRTGTYALSEGNRYLAATCDSGASTIRLYDMIDGKILCDLDVPRTNSHSGFAFSPDNTRLAAMGLNEIHTWDVATGQEFPALRLNPNVGDGGHISGGCVVFSPDGRLIGAARACFQSDGGTPVGEVYIWDANDGTEIARIEGSGYQNGAVVFSPDSRVLAVPVQNQNVLLLKAASGRELGRLEGNEASGVGPLAFSPDGRLLAASGQKSFTYVPFRAGGQVSAAGQRIVVWELASGQIREEFVGHTGIISCLTFAPDSRTLASGSSDTTVLLWDTSGQRDENFHPWTPSVIEAAWTNLADKNSRHAYQEWMSGMISSPDGTVEVLRRHLTPRRGTKAVAENIDRLIADLDNGAFALRVKATNALLELGALAGPALRKAQSAQPSVESQRRLRFLLEHLDRITLSTDEIRLARAVEVLEKIGTREARGLLRDLASGRPYDFLTREAQEALSRLKNVTK
jgi:WD40 repeat protein